MYITQQYNTAVVIKNKNMAYINMKYEFIILIHSINNMLVNYFCLKSQYVLEDTVRICSCVIIYH